MRSCFVDEKLETSVAAEVVTVRKDLPGALTPQKPLRPPPNARAADSFHRQARSCDTIITELHLSAGLTIGTYPQLQDWVTEVLTLPCSTNNLTFSLELNDCYSLDSPVHQPPSSAYIHCSTIRTNRHGRHRRHGHCRVRCCRVKDADRHRQHDKLQ